VMTSSKIVLAFCLLAAAIASGVAGVFAAINTSDKKTQSYMATWSLIGSFGCCAVFAVGALLVLLENYWKVGGIRALWTVAAMSGLWFLAGAAGSLIISDSENAMDNDLMAELWVLIIANCVAVIALAVVLVNPFHDATAHPSNFVAFILHVATLATCGVALGLDAYNYSNDNGFSPYVGLLLSGTSAGAVLSLGAMLLLLSGHWCHHVFARFLWSFLYFAAFWLIAACLCVGASNIDTLTNNILCTISDKLRNDYCSLYRAEFGLSVAATGCMILTSSYFVAFASSVGKHTYTIF